MDSISYYIIAPFLTLIVSVAVFCVSRIPQFDAMNYWAKQVFLGVIFGALAVFNISRGVGVANSRDVPLLISGLIFGTPAAVISSTIAAVMCFFKEFSTHIIDISPFLNAVTALFTGFFASALRKILFSDNKPTLFYSFGIGVVSEVLYMLTIFMVNISNLEQTFLFVSKWAYVFIFINGMTVMLSVLADKLISGEKLTLARGKRFISILAQRWLLNCVILAFMLSCFFTYYLQGVISRENCNELLRLNIEDAKADIYDASEKRMLSLAEKIVVEIKHSNLDVVALENKVAEIVIVDWHGIIMDSNVKEHIGYDMASGEQSAEFLCLLKGEKYLVQEYQPISFDNSVARKYAGIALDTGGFLQVGYDLDDFQKEIDHSIKDATANRHLGKNGFLLIIDNDFTIVSDGSGRVGKDFKVSDMNFGTDIPEYERFSADVYGEPCYCMYSYFDGYYIIAIQPISEVSFMMNMTICVMTFMEIVIFFTLFILTYLLFKKLVVDNINNVNERLSEITDGNLSVTVDVRNNEEFSALSDDINATVDTLKRYINEAAARIDRELELGKVIQESTLPTTFPPFPEYKQLDIFASMNAAKEVGGDFYDFYLLDDDNLAFLIADVSGKGVTGAMFMMKAKTLIKSFAGKSTDPAEILTMANSAICEGNEAEMFVTCWMAVLNFKTGKLSFANAGHNPPLIRHGDSSYEYLKSRPGFVLGGMDCIKYRKAEIDFALGDSIFLYTDGVPEATDGNGAMYDEERLINTVNSVRDSEAKEICHVLRSSVDEFVGDAPQFDDITMLCLKLITPAPDAD